MRTRSFRPCAWMAVGACCVNGKTDGGGGGGHTRGPFFLRCMRRCPVWQPRLQEGEVGCNMLSLCCNMLSLCCSMLTRTMRCRRSQGPSAAASAPASTSVQSTCPSRNAQSSHTAHCCVSRNRRRAPQASGLQMWQRVSPVPVQMWQVYAVPFRHSGRRQRRRSSAPRCNQTQAQRNLAGWWALAGVGRGQLAGVSGRSPAGIPGTNLVSPNDLVIRIGRQVAPFRPSCRKPGAAWARACAMWRAVCVSAMCVRDGA